MSLNSLNNVWTSSLASGKAVKYLENRQQSDSLTDSLDGLLFLAFDFRHVSFHPFSFFFLFFFLLTTPPLLFLRFNFIFFNALASFLSLRGRRERKRNPLYRVSYIRKSYPEACLAPRRIEKKGEKRPSLRLFSLSQMTNKLKCILSFAFSRVLFFSIEKLRFLRIAHTDTKVLEKSFSAILIQSLRLIVEEEMRNERSFISKFKWLLTSITRRIARLKAGYYVVTRPCKR